MQTFRLREIAAEIGCSYSAVIVSLKKFEINVPTRTNYRKSLTKSESCKAAYARMWPNGRFGSLAANWKGGKRKTGSGYKQILMPEHPSSDCQGYVMEHTLIAEKNIGRQLTNEEVTHHIDGNKENNKEENIEVLSRSQHVQLHFDATKEVARLKAILDKRKIPY